MLREGSTAPRQQQMVVAFAVGTVVVAVVSVLPALLR